MLIYGIIRKLNLTSYIMLNSLPCDRDRDQTTIFTILLGTTITFFGVFPSKNFCVSTASITIFSISCGESVKGNSMLKRIFPLKEIGYEKLSSTKCFSSNIG